jgi:hypothetical protein
MIRESNAFFTDQEQPQHSAQKPIDQEFEGVIGDAIEQAVAQYHSLLRHGLDIEVKRIIQEFEEATLNIDATIARRVRARLVEMVQEEVRRVFDDTLTNAEQTMVDPIWAKARDRHLSYITDFSRPSSKR